MSVPVAASRAGWAEPGSRPPLARVGRLMEGTFVIARAELQKLRHDPLDLFTRAAQPLLWLFVFGTALRHTQALTASGYDYRTYIAPGVMAQAALFIAIFFGLAIIWERDLGQLQRLLATPLPRTAIVLGKAAGAAVRAIAQALLLLVVVAAAGIGFRWRLEGIVGALALLALGTAAFACLSMLLASLLRTRERFMGLGQLLVMPLFFASSALYPISIMPTWLRAIASGNPLTYEVHGLRELLIGYSAGGTLWLDFLVTAAFFLALLVAAARAYPRAIL
jgi:ABC-2 type transport system permease protein